MISTRPGVFTKAVLTIKQPDCSDTGQYRCLLKVSNNAGITNLQGDFHLNATGTQSMVVRQPEQSVYPSPTRIRLECSGIVTDWSWQWRHPGDRLTWQSFPFTDNVTVEKLLDPRGDGTTSVCQGETRTVLTYLTKAQENGVQFRCTFSESGTTATTRIPFTTVCIEQEPTNLKMEVIRDIDNRPSSVVCSGVTRIMREEWRWEWRSPPSYPNWSAYHNRSESRRTLNNNNCSYSTRSTLNLTTDTVTELRCILGNSYNQSLNLKFNITDRVKDKDCSSCECKLRKVYSTSGKHCQDLLRLYKDCLSIEDINTLGCLATASVGVGILTHSSVLLHLVSFVVIFNCSFRVEIN
ncbi:uncharacterized protein LOC126829343 [Patella vulgata]|uniref:uncharacterized protein LOC126829343 n=1 Tax=Patella vulgata TaxID=6465 RepID=UPI0024A90BE5|nr:uncharacterized protein LOC126829343 [Patella vulgata]